MKSIGNWKISHVFWISLSSLLNLSVKWDGNSDWPIETKWGIIKYRVEYKLENTDLCVYIYIYIFEYEYIFCSQISFYWRRICSKMHKSCVNFCTYMFTLVTTLQINIFITLESSLLPYPFYNSPELTTLLTSVTKDYFWISLNFHVYMES